MRERERVGIKYIKGEAEECKTLHRGRKRKKRVKQ
jgi:hypothetical protein